MSVSTINTSSSQEAIVVEKEAEDPRHQYFPVVSSLEGGVVARILGRRTEKLWLDLETRQKRREVLVENPNILLSPNNHN
jgi:hypothetical protein